MRVEIGPGESVIVVLGGTDGAFTVSYGKKAVTVVADLPDSSGREGIIYSEEWGTPLLPPDTDD